MRIKLNPVNKKGYKCCFCCHVRTGTILLGIFVLLVELISLAGLLVMMLHPEVLQMPHDVSVIPDPELNISPENNDSFLSYSWIRNKQEDGQDNFFAFLFLSGMVAVSGMLIYGAIMGRPGYLMPYFCIQVFNFCMTCLSGIGYFSYMPNIKQWIETQPDLPFVKEWLLSMDNDWLMLICVLSFALVLFIEAYLIGMVWSCYQYLIEYERNVAHGTIPVRSYSAERTEDAEMLLPPKYEDAVRMAADEPPPPPYAS